MSLKQEIAELKKMVEELKKNQKSHCSECGKPYVEAAPIYPMPFPYPVSPDPYPYIPGTPIGPYWTWPNWTISSGTISNPLDGVNLINTFNQNQSGDGGSTI